MKYCIRGIANVWGGHQVELLIEMKEWLEGRSLGEYHIPRYDEAKFNKRKDAETFARKWFESGKWRLHEMLDHCSMTCTPRMKKECSPSCATFHSAISSFPTPEARPVQQ